MELKNALFLYLLFLLVFLPACGGGGGGGSTIATGGVGVITTASHSLQVFFVEDGSQPSPTRAIANRFVLVNGVRYSVNTKGITPTISVEDDGVIFLDDGTRLTADFATGEGLFVKVTDFTTSGRRMLSKVWFKPQTGGGVVLRGALLERANQEYTGQSDESEQVQNGSFEKLLGGYMSRMEARLAPQLSIAAPQVNNEQLFASLAINPFLNFSGEVELYIEPSGMTLEIQTGGQLISRLRDETGTTAIVQSSWTVTPVGVVDVDITGYVTTTEVPGSVIVQARFENQYATAEVVIVREVDGIEISGRLNEDTTLYQSQKYVVMGDLIVPAGITLTIEPVTQISFLANADNAGSGENAARSEIIVEGTLNAIGFETRQTVMQSTNEQNPTNHEFYGIRVVTGGVVNLDRVTIQDSIYGIKSNGGTVNLSKCRFYNCQVGVYSEEGKINVEACEFIGCVSSIECHYLEEGFILRNYMSDLTYNAISLYNSSPVIYGNIILRSKASGLGIYNRSIPKIFNNLIADCLIYGAVANLDARPRLFNNIVTYCEVAGFYFIAKSGPEITNNIFLRNHLGMGYEDDVILSFHNNNFSGSRTFNFINPDQGKDLYLDGTVSTILSHREDIFYAVPDFVDANFVHPSDGDFTLKDGSILLISGEDSTAVGLIDPSDLGTASVKVGQAVH